MDDLETQAGRAALISRMFALLTAKLEDAAGIAADCQGKRPAEELRQGAQALLTLAEEAATLACAVVALLERADPSPSC